MTLPPNPESAVGAIEQRLRMADSRGARAHLVGVCGAGMKALAEVLAARGWSVSGCDRDPDPQATRSLLAQQVSLVREHAATHVDAAVDVVIYSPAIPEDHLERRRAADCGVPALSYVAALAALSRDADCVAVAGTHGKSTTTALLGHLLRAAGRSPTVVCGAADATSGRSGIAGAEPLVVLEACEYRRHFLQFAPRLAILLGIEADHFDCYPELADAEAAYRDFAARVPADGWIVHRADCSATRRAIAGAAARKISFSVDDPAADWRAEAIAADGLTMRFCLQHAAGGGWTAVETLLAAPGRHNVLNALAAAAAACALGVPLGQASSALASFPGLKRRFEVVSATGPVIVDDFAHHPTEVRAALDAARAAFPGREICCVFQPHQLSRTRALSEEFARALCAADAVGVLPVYAAREAGGAEQVDASRELAARVVALGGRATWIPTLDRIWTTVETGGDFRRVILTLGAGDLTRIHHEFTERLS